ncbi:peptidylprolyl isomerase [Rhabdochromatium marinum]|uniref:peptidylprolyl isomerase n=1 Tax=Rhabdochromatium marinum TaxID=48729 RepID=UPI001902D4FF|nr:peptidylprolyl isomerase [Rhabdochromatium marinum]
MGRSSLLLWNSTPAQLFYSKHVCGKRFALPAFAGRFGEAYIKMTLKLTMKGNILISCPKLFARVSLCCLIVATQVYAEDSLISGDGFNLMSEDVEAELSTFPVYMQQQIRRSPGKLRSLIDDLWRRELVVVEAEKQNVDDIDAFHARLVRARKEELVSIMLDKKGQDVAENFPDFAEQAKEHFRINRDKYRRPERVSASHILLKAKTEEERQQRIPEMKAIRERALKGEDFAELAREYSEDQGSSKAGGSLGVFPRGKMTPKFEQAAFALEKPGDISDIIETPFGIHIIRLESRQEQQDLSFDDVKDEIIVKLKQDYLRERVKQWYEDLTDASHVKGNTEAIDAYVDATVEVANKEDYIKIPNMDNP